MATASHEVRIGKQGRVVIPAELREALHLRPGDTLLARVENGRLVLATREAVERELWAMFEDLPEEVSLAEELIAERRREVRRDREALRRS